MAEPDKFGNPGHKDKVAEWLENAYRKEKLVDVSLIVAGKKFPVYSSFLAFWSKYFHSLFFNDFKEKKKEIEIKGVSVTGLQSVLDFCYTGQVVLCKDNLNEVLEAATHLQVTEMIGFVDAFVAQSVGPDTCMDYLYMSNSFKLEACKHKVKKCLLTNFAAAAKTERFLSLSLEQLKDLLSDPRLKTDSELDLLRSAARWMEAKPERLAHAKEIMDSISNKKPLEEAQKNDPPRIEGSYMKIDMPNSNKQSRWEIENGDDDSESMSEPGETKDLGIIIRNLPLRSSDTSLRDGLFHEYKKCGKVTSVRVSGMGPDRFAIVSFRTHDNAAKAMTDSQDKTFFGAAIEVKSHEGFEAEEPEVPVGIEMNEFHNKATRSLFIGNLEKEISTQMLRDIFKEYGIIIEIDIKKQGAVTAYGFVQYMDISSVVKALKAMSGARIGNNEIKLGFGKSQPSNCIWLDSVADTVKENFLVRQFARYGPVSHTVIDRVKGRALVYMETVDFSQHAVDEMRGRILNGQRIHVDFASRECQKVIFEEMEKSGQLKPGERPDERGGIFFQGAQTTITLPPPGVAPPGPRLPPVSGPPIDFTPPPIGSDFGRGRGIHGQFVHSVPPPPFRGGAAGVVPPFRPGAPPPSPAPPGWVSGGGVVGGGPTTTGGMSSTGAPQYYDDLSTSYPPPSMDDPATKVWDQPRSRYDFDGRQPPLPPGEEPDYMSPPPPLPPPDSFEQELRDYGHRQAERRSTYPSGMMDRPPSPPYERQRSMDRFIEPPYGQDPLPQPPTPRYRDNSSPGRDWDARSSRNYRSRDRGPQSPEPYRGNPRDPRTDIRTEMRSAMRSPEPRQMRRGMPPEPPPQREYRKERVNSSDRAYISDRYSHDRRSLERQRGGIGPPMRARYSPMGSYSRKSRSPSPKFSTPSMSPVSVDEPLPPRGNNSGRIIKRPMSPPSPQRPASYAYINSPRTSNSDTESEYSHKKKKKKRSKSYKKEKGYRM